MMYLVFFLKSVYKVDRIGCKVPVLNHDEIWKQCLNAPYCIAVVPYARVLIIIV